MRQQEALEIFKEAGAVIEGGHFVFAGGRHGPTFVDAELIYPDTEKTSRLCLGLAERFRNCGVEAVVAPEKGGIILSWGVANCLSQITPIKVLAFYAEKNERGDFVIERSGARNKLPGRRVLVVDDVLTTGGSVRRVVKKLLAMDCLVVGIGALWNRGGVAEKDMQNIAMLQKFIALVNLELSHISEMDCKLTGPCSCGVPINTEYGHGQEFLASHPR